jgi:hypothetical protein
MTRNLLSLLWIAAAAGPVPAAAPEQARPRFDRVPGVVVDHSPASSGIYIGSPSLAVLPDGDYMASHDEFGPKSTEHVRAVTRVFRSSDRGQRWKRVSTIDGQFWSNLFVHQGALYILGTDKHHGNAIIRRSTDRGATWTSPTDSRTGLLRDNGEYHCAPMPVVVHQGRLWRGMEWRNPPIAWGINYRAGMLSVPVEADLLNAANWTFCQFLPSDRSWNGGDMGAWLEGNAVVAPGGELVDVLRVQTRSPDEKAAIVRISADGKTATFDPETGFVQFPGGAKKFAIRFDPQSKLYWSLATIVTARHRANNPGGIRNTLALTCSPDLVQWTVRCILLYHPDVAQHGFQYVDWLFDGEDLVAACRTACDDGVGGAHNNHDANFLTFHRFAGFRRLTMADSVAMPELPSVRHELGDFLITGRGFELARLDNGEKAFSNRTYVWENVPERFRRWHVTRTGGGERAEIKVEARRDATLHMATASAQTRLELTGWQKSDATFAYTDRGHTAMTVFSRAVKAGEVVAVPQGNWTGGLVLLPGD